MAITDTVIDNLFEHGDLSGFTFKVIDECRWINTDLSESSNNG